MDEVRRFLRDDRGAALWEYALGIIVGLGILALIIRFRDRIGQVFVAATDSLRW
jgi:Flp pilus assembly pilin Flp